MQALINEQRTPGSPTLACLFGNAILLMVKKMKVHGLVINTPGMIAWLAVSMWIAGCAKPSGSWALAETEPKGSSFPFSAMTFDNAGQYQAQGFFTPDGDFRTEPQESSGKIKSTGLWAKLQPNSGPLSYSLSRRWDGRMVVSYVPPGESKPVTAVFERSPEVKKSGDVEPMSVAPMKFPPPEGPSPVTADPTTSYNSGTKQKLPG